MIVVDIIIASFVGTTNIAQTPVGTELILSFLLYSLCMETRKRTCCASIMIEFLEQSEAIAGSVCNR